jgi:hypothetical protein
MFAKAYEIASSFTQPLVLSFRRPDGECGSQIGCFVVLNQEGWCLTATHILDSIREMEDAKRDFPVFLKEKGEIENDARINAKTKRRRIAKLAEGRKFLTHHSVWWAWDGARVVAGHGLKGVDIAAVKLEPFGPNVVKQYPVIKNPEGNLTPGTILCRLGFPFHTITPTFDSARGFLLPKGAGPFPRFPIEGILTRNVHLEIRDLQDRPAFPLWMIETSSPGLRGQSGGPIFDRNGVVWSIQSRTISWPLGIDAKVGEKDGRALSEHQVLNTGLGVHPKTLCSFLDDLGIEYKKSDD